MQTLPLTNNVNTLEPKTTSRPSWRNSIRVFRQTILMVAFSCSIPACTTVVSSSGRETQVLSDEGRQLIQAVLMTGVGVASSTIAQRSNTSLNGMNLGGLASQAVNVIPNRRSVSTSGYRQNGYRQYSNDRYGYGLITN